MVGADSPAPRHLTPTGVIGQESAPHRSDAGPTLPLRQSESRPAAGFFAAVTLS